MDNISKLENDHHKAYIELVFILEATSTILQARKVLKVCVVVCFFFFFVLFLLSASGLKDTVRTV